MKIVFVTQATYHIEWYSQYTTLFHSTYCEKHNYIYERYTELFNPNRFATWDKFLVVLDALEKHPECDYVFWCDADCIPLNMDIPLETYITDDDIIMTQDHNPPDYSRLYKYPFNINAPCTGNFFVKNNESTKKFFTKLYNDGKFMMFHFKQNQYHEQSAFTLALLDVTYASMCSIRLLDPYVLFHNELNRVTHFYHAQGQANPYISKSPLRILYEQTFGKKA